ncbi:MAG: hypothetical protein ACLUD2_18565 [Clostridium sp.]
MIQSEIKEKLTNRMISEDIGLSVRFNITIQDAFPPTEEVLSAFKNVENAKQGKETAINSANKDQRRSAGRGRVRPDHQECGGGKGSPHQRGPGPGGAFEQMYGYSKYPLITKQRMFYRPWRMCFRP